MDGSSAVVTTGIFTGPLDWDAMLGYLAARAIKGVEAVSGGVHRRTILVDGDPGRSRSSDARRTALWSPRTCAIGAA